MAGWMTGAFLAAATSGCMGPALMAGTLVAPTAASVGTVAMAMKSGESMSQTRWYDGIERLDQNDPAAIRLAKLQDAAREIEARIGVPVTTVEVEVLAKLYEARNGDLETFARDRRLTRAQIDSAVKALREKGLVSYADRPGRPGGYEVALAAKMAALGDPMDLGRNTPPVFAMNDEAR